MKTTPISKLTGVRLAIAVAVFAGTAGVLIADETTTTKDVVAEVISLRAPNTATQTVTIWKPRAVSRNAPSLSNARTRTTTATVIDLHAPNSATPSVTVQTARAENQVEVAPLK